MRVLVIWLVGTMIVSAPAPLKSVARDTGLQEATRQDTTQREAVDWEPAKDQLMTRWAKEVSPDNALPEYPRPIMVRPQWMSLNGLWEFAVTSKVVSTSLPTSEKHRRAWRYTTDKPPPGWQDPAFDDSQWKTGKGAFGTTMTPNVRIGTVWDQPDIYVRSSFALETIPAAAGLRIYHDEDAEVYVNGRLVQQFKGFTTYYTDVLNDKVAGLLKKGENTIAVHCHQTGGGQAIDVGIIEMHSETHWELKPDKYDGHILVPYCIESPLSGVHQRFNGDKALWYRRSLTVPKQWQGQRILLHFGAVDWHCRVLLNGKEVGSHQGGYDPFHFDITDFLTDGANELVVMVKDPTSSGNQARGKQMDAEGGIFYTSTSGIWQTVWLEPVPSDSIEELIIVPDIDNATLRVTVNIRGTGGTDEVRIAAKTGETKIASAMGTVGDSIELKISSPKLWSPDNPFLYDLTVELLKDREVVDSVKSYFAMRKISIGKDARRIPRIMLNNKAIFQYGLLDQGYWPDGIYTAPTDEALRYDIEVTKSLGMNMIRKHVKIEPARWYYHCDRLGILVWQDMPNGPTAASEASKRQFRAELKAMVDFLRNYPSVVVWIPFNEAWGQHDSVEIANWIKKYDTSRLVTEASGWSDHGAGDIKDVHSYPGPNFSEIPHSRLMPEAESERAIVIGESGGMGINIPGHLWKNGVGWGWLNLKDSAALTDFYLVLLERLEQLIPKGLCAAVYTQTSDIETECNGLMTYDREVIKLEMERAVAATHKLYNHSGTTFQVLVATSLEQPQEWQYTTATPAAGWQGGGFDDQDWQTGKGVFGSERMYKNISIGTAWTEKQIYLRRTFVLRRVPEEFGLRIYHDEEADIYINGRLVKKIEGWVERDGYLTALKDVFVGKANGVLREGENTMAVYCRQTTGSQAIDVGVLEVLRSR
ncbi:MAG: glycoside hydrolase family 2 [Pirellulales bacterium]|nr:glycoside hydrolase family 2 [Pirellulales bacterium]